MMQAAALDDVVAVNIGLETFATSLADQGARVLTVDWRPPADGDRELVAALSRLWGAHGDRVRDANRQAFERIEAAAPRAVGVMRASDAIEPLEDGVILHSGPPITWDRVCDPQRRAILAAVLFEEWAPDREAAARMLADGEIRLLPGSENGHVGPMTGICSPSMPVWVVEDDVSGTVAHSTFNEGPGNTLWFGVGDDESIERLRFFRDQLGPTLARVLEAEGPVDIFALVAQGLNMGDELHMRSQATGNLLLRDLAGGLAAAGAEREARFIAGNHHFFLTLTMAAAKCAALAATGIEGSTVVTSMSRNGTDMGIQLSGMPGRWFIAPAAPVADALLRDGHTPEDAARDIGDSAIIECVGIGGMALAAAPVVASFFGGDAAAARARTEQMREICVGESARFRIANISGAGTPTAIDARLVAELGITPQITTGVLHASSGVGQIGAGVAHQPVEPFRDAIAALAAELDAAGAAV